MAEALRAGYGHVIDADLSQYFETIPHAKLMAVLAERMADGAVFALIQQWLKAPVVEEDPQGTTRRSGEKDSDEALPGGVLSPLLANLYLHVLDRTWARPEVGRGLRTSSCGTRMIWLCCVSGNGALADEAPRRAEDIGVEPE